MLAPAGSMRAWRVRQTYFLIIILMSTCSVLARKSVAQTLHSVSQALPAAAPAGAAQRQPLTMQSRVGVRRGVQLRVDSPRAASASIPHLDYYGGPIISQVQVYAVFWGSHVNSKVRIGIGGFYTAITGSALFDWLTEYNTTIPSLDGSPGTNQTLQHGSFAGTITIAPSNTRRLLSDDDIQAEIALQIQAQVLPAPTADTLFAIYFPPGFIIDDGTGHLSCHDFCAYHSTMASSPHDLYYAVVPDFGKGSGCDLGCGTDPIRFNNVTAVSSHELIEAVTDPEVGLATDYAPPLAWYDAVNGEVADICVGSSGTLAGYVVQKAWSNQYGRCQVVPPPPPSSAPANDACTSRTVVTTLPLTEPGLDTTGATTDPSDPLHSCSGSKDASNVWYQITPQSSSAITFDTSGTDYSTIVTVYAGTCGALTEIGCFAGHSGAVTMIEGTTYLVEVSQFGEEGGGSLVLRAHVSHAPQAFHVAGDLDPTFGDAGVVTTDLGNAAEAQFALAQTDGKIVVAGTISPTNHLGSYLEPTELVVVRYNVDGSVDTTFATRRHWRGMML